MASGQCVLVVDGLTETEEVLKAVLERRGIQVDRIRSDGQAGQRRDTAPPSVIVIHADGTARGPRVASRWEHVPRVIIGSADLSRQSHPAGKEHCLQEPFHYRELIQAIEDLLAGPSLPTR